MNMCKLIASGVLFLTLTACVPLMRGIENGAVVSGGKPPATLSSTLPLKVSGRADPFIYTDLGFQTPDAYVAVYGAADVASPMAIVAFSEAPDIMRWNYASFTFVDGPVTSQVNFGGQAFSGAVRIVSGVDDAFTPLVASEEEAPNVWWLVQRYTVLENFFQSKVILEYREPLPESLRGMVEVPVFNTEVEAFAARAQAAFKVDFAYTGQPIERAPVIPDVNRRYLGRFLGSLEPLEPLPFDND